MSKYFWTPSSDGTIIYVKKMYDWWIFKNRIKTIAYFYSSGEAGAWEYTAAVRVAEKLIKRLEGTS